MPEIAAPDHHDDEPTEAPPPRRNWFASAEPLSHEEAERLREESGLPAGFVAVPAGRDRFA